MNPPRSLEISRLRLSRLHSLMMEQSMLLSLPPELQDHIVSYTTQPSVLKNLCLTCKQLRGVATPKLYHFVALDLQSPSLSEEDKDFLSVDNPGHRHVRHLAFFVTHEHPSHMGRSTEERCYANMKRVLSVLPWHRLESFAAPSQMKFDGPTFSMLCSQQHALTELSIGILNKPMPSTIATQTKFLKNITSLSLPADAGSVVLSLYGQLIQHAPNLRNLAINGMDYLEFDRIEQVLPKLIFPRQQCQTKPLHLQTVSLIGLDFRGAGDFTATMIEVENLAELKIGHSKHVAELLDAAAHKFRQTKPRLRGLEIIDYDSDGCLIALQMFLRSFSGLQYLKLIGDDDDNDFSMTSLASHASTLTDIYMSFGQSGDGSEERVKTNDELLRFFARHKKLRQVAIDCPLLYDNDLNSGSEMADYTRYLVSVSNAMLVSMH